MWLLLCFGVLFGRVSSSPVVNLPLVILCPPQGQHATAARATTLALAEINAQGGFKLGDGRRMRAVAIYATRASQVKGLLQKNRSRLLIQADPALESGQLASTASRHSALLLDCNPVQSDPLSESVVVSGPAANQQIAPVLQFLMSNHGPRVFLVGSGTSRSRHLHTVAREQAGRAGGVVVGEYRQNGEQSFTDLCDAIWESRCNAVLCSLDSHSQRQFLQAYGHAGLSPTNVPVVTLATGEADALEMRQLMLGHYSVWPYFMALDNPANHRFLRGFRRRYGADLNLDDAAQTAYWQIFALSEAIERSPDLNPDSLRRGLRTLVLDTPSGLVRYDPRNLCCWRAVRVAQVREQGPMRVVWSTPEPIRPVVGRHSGLQ